VTTAKDVHSLFRDHLGVEKAIVVGYDIGMMVAVSLALQFPGSVEGLVGFGPFFFLPSFKYPSDLRLTLAEAPVPGTKAYDDVTTDPESAYYRLFHFFFHNGPDNLAEMLTERKEREYITHFYDRLVQC
jgi:pimeloyl-ACP methyl ester carboxylesterase